MVHVAVVLLCITAAVLGSNAQFEIQNISSPCRWVDALVFEEWAGQRRHIGGSRSRSHPGAAGVGNEIAQHLSSDVRGEGATTNGTSFAQKVVQGRGSTRPRPTSSASTTERFPGRRSRRRSSLKQSQTSWRCWVSAVRTSSRTWQRSCNNWRTKAAAAAAAEPPQQIKPQVAFQQSVTRVTAARQAVQKAQAAFDKVPRNIERLVSELEAWRSKYVCPGGAKAS